MQSLYFLLIYVILSCLFFWANWALFAVKPPEPTLPDLQLDDDYCMGDCSNCSCGVLYLLSLESAVFPGYKKAFAGGRKPHLQALSRAIESFKYHNPKLRALLVTDQHSLPQNLTEKFDDIRYISTKGQTKPWQEMTQALLENIYERVLVIDADTTVCGNLTEAFSILSTFDVATVQHALWLSDLFKSWNNTRSFSYANGVQRATRSYGAFLLYRRSMRTKRFIDDFRHCDISTAHPHQACLHRTLLTSSSNVRHVMMPPEYLYVNRTFEVPVLLNGEVKIVHGLGASCADINKYQGPRLYNGRLGQIWSMQPVTDSTVIEISAAAHNCTTLPRRRWMSFPM